MVGITGLRVGDHVGYDVVGESEIGDIVLGLVNGLEVGLDLVVDGVSVGD